MEYQAYTGACIRLIFMGATDEHPFPQKHSIRD